MNTIELTFNLGCMAFDEKDYGTAISRFTEVLDEVPGDRNVREWRARAYYHRASLPRAEEDLRELLAADPTDEYATLLLARTLERQSRHDEAAGVRRMLAALTGDDAHAEGHRAFS